MLQRPIGMRMMMVMMVAIVMVIKHEWGELLCMS